MNKIKVSPSILASDFTKLGEEVKSIERAGADYLHIDIMDGHFVPNITFGPRVVEHLRKVTKLPFDVHLMIENPDDYLEVFAEAGADIIGVHYEACTHLDRTISKIKELGKKVCVILSPATNEDVLDYVLDKLDMVLIMTVNPGFGGQEFINSQIEKIENVRKKIDNSGLNIELEVDGGINDETCKKVIKAGANVLVAGSFIFKGKTDKERRESINKLRMAK